MKIKEISEEEFYAYKVIKNPAAEMFSDENKWFVNGEHNLLGIITMDKFDKDWGYIILGMDSDEAFRSIEVNISYETKEEAEKAFSTIFTSLSEKGKKEEILFETREEVIERPKSLIVTDIDEEIKRYFKNHPEKLYDLSPKKFEELIASILQDLGFDVELTKATKDGGRDIIAKIRTKVTSLLTYIECKRYKPDCKVGVGIIREVLGVHYFRKPAKSIIVTTSFFSKDAISEAKSFENQLDLKDYNDIKNWLQHY